MNSSKLATLTFGAAAAFALIAGPSFAQNYVEPKQPYYDNSEDIIVTAPGVTHYDTGRRTSSGAPIETVTAQRVVDTSDLDLRYNEDVRELHQRITDAAIDGCREVDRATQVPLDSNRDCIRAATRDAMAQADDMIAIARG